METMTIEKMYEFIKSSTNPKEFNDNIEHCMEILYGEAWDERISIAVDHRNKLRMVYKANADDWAWRYAQYKSALKWSEVKKLLMSTPEHVLDLDNEYLCEYGFFIYINNMSGFLAE